MINIIVYVLLSDSDGTLHSTPEPFGVAVTSKEEAEKFVKDIKFGYRNSYMKIKIFNTAIEAIEYWKKEIDKNNNVSAQ